MGVRLLHSLCVYVIFYVIFVPGYQFGEQGLTWWPVINFYSSAACAYPFTTGNYVAGRPCHHKGSHTFDWYESLALDCNSLDARAAKRWIKLSGFKVSLSFKRKYFGAFKLSSDSKKGKKSQFI